MKIFITKKGEEAFSVNNWKEGQEIDIHENHANKFIEKGLATSEKEVEPKEEGKSKK